MHLPRRVEWVVTHPVTARQQQQLQQRTPGVSWRPCCYWELTSSNCRAAAATRIFPSNAVWMHHTT